MPDKYKSDNPVLSYRRYYMSPEKQRIASWNKNREKPKWYKIRSEDKPKRKKYKFIIINKNVVS